MVCTVSDFSISHYDRSMAGFSPPKTLLPQQRKAYVCTAPSHLHARQTEGLSLRAKIESFRGLPAHYQTPVSVTTSASVHEEVATDFDGPLHYKILFVHTPN